MNSTKELLQDIESPFDLKKHDLLLAMPNKISHITNLLHKSPGDLRFISTKSHHYYNPGTVLLYLGEARNIESRYGDDPKQIFFIKVLVDSKVYWTQLYNLCKICL